MSKRLITYHMIKEHNYTHIQLFPIALSTKFSKPGNCVRTVLHGLTFDRRVAHSRVSLSLMKKSIDFPKNLMLKLTGKDTVNVFFDSHELIHK